MVGGLAVRPAVAGDRDQWRVLWNEYCAFYQVVLDERVTETLWFRIMDPGAPVNALVAVDEGGRLLGFCHYVLHLHTWSCDPVCYLEDLFTAADARGQGAGRALIDRLRALGVEAGWNRVYWHTGEDNHTARALYDKVTGGRDAFVRYMIPLARRG